MQKYDLIILGAGASGLACSAFTPLNKKICIIDHANIAGKKLSICGGGKGNITNLNMGPEHYYSSNPHFCISALKRFPPKHLLNFLDKNNFAYEERELGQIFCQKKASDFKDLFLEKSHHCKFLFNRSLKKVEKKDGFCVYTDNETLKTDNLLLALGSSAHPQLGSTDLGIKLAKKFGHKVSPASPALTSFIIKDWPFKNLSGVSLPARIKVIEKNKDIKLKEYPYTLPLLFTHTGISGPAAMQASLLWDKGSIEMDFLPNQSMEEILKEPGKGRLLLHNLLKQFFPASFVKSLINATGHDYLHDKKVAELNNKERSMLVNAVHYYLVKPDGLDGKKRAEVMRGGVLTEDLSSRSFESLIVPGLYFSGELLDVTGRLGGYNLHWAYASGLAVANSIFKQS